MDKKGEHSTYRIISGVHHRIQVPPVELTIMSLEELRQEVRALVQIINSGRLHNEKQKVLISALESQLKVFAEIETQEPPIRPIIQRNFQCLH